MLNFNTPPSVGWDDPIDMLYACHGKVKGFCRQLRILPEYLQTKGINQAVKNDVRQILTYFNHSAPLHHEDEEKDFFPALLRYVPDAQQDIDALERQHLDLHQNWTRLSVQLEALLNDERMDVDRTLIDAFIAAYDRHIAREEPLFELGKQQLSIDELQAMGKIMAARRKI
ncbi:hemerythrin domain-containing protein [Necropsobacter massiliensis]|uniref:hemerythrin domain-containing protein n=1 Tax=Necropsobacter massiliensis TaxID=1400001 RepID=UPI00059598A4|nr:hemerythrin domain-containing protein [Necropsobacter massiliensis]